MAIQVQPDQEDTVLRVTAYHRLDYDLVVIRSPPHELDAMRGSLLEPFSAPPITPLGNLGVIPIEILSAICLEMDVRSLFRFRHVNKLARNVVLALLPYRQVISYALEAFRASLRTRIGINFTLADMHNALCSPKCRTCGMFGNFLFLPDVKRACWTCLNVSHGTGVATLDDLAKFYSKSKTELRQLLPVLHPVPGVYTMRQLRRTGRRVELVSTNAALALALSRRGVLKSKIHHIDWFRTHHHPYTHEDWKPAMVSTAFPYPDRTTGQVDHGLMCKGCHFRRTFRAHCTYTKREFLRHFRACPRARVFWEASRGGTVEFGEPEVTKRGGTLDLYSNGIPR